MPIFIMNSQWSTLSLTMTFVWRTITISVGTWWKLTWENCGHPNLWSNGSGSSLKKKKIEKRLRVFFFFLEIEEMVRVLQKQKGSVMGFGGFGSSVRFDSVQFGSLFLSRKKQRKLKFWRQKGLGFPSLENGSTVRVFQKLNFVSSRHVDRLESLSPRTCQEW